MAELRAARQEFLRRPFTHQTRGTQSLWVPLARDRPVSSCGALAIAPITYFMGYVGRPHREPAVDGEVFRHSCPADRLLYYFERSFLLRHACCRRLTYQPTDRPGTTDR